MFLISYIALTLAVVVGRTDAAAIGTGSIEEGRTHISQNDLRFGKHEDEVEHGEDPGLRFGLIEEQKPSHVGTSADTDGIDQGELTLGLLEEDDQGELRFGKLEEEVGPGDNLRYGRRRREAMLNPPLRVGESSEGAGVLVKLDKRGSTVPPELRIGRK